jgi:hypothetical protein
MVKEKEIVMKKLWQKFLCLWAGYHDEELWRRRKDQRYLLWICKRCGKVTKSFKMNKEQIKLFKSIKRIH